MKLASKKLSESLQELEKEFVAEIKMSLNNAIEKLGKENYDSWRIQMEALSIKNGNWAHIFGKYTCPKALTYFIYFML